MIVLPANPASGRGHGARRLPAARRAFAAAVADAATVGTHAARPEVVERRAASVRVRFAEPPAYEADGELRQAASDEVEVACVPGALRLAGG